MVEANVQTESTTAAPRRLEKLRSRVRRLQLVLGLGFFCAVVGAIISASLAIKLQAHLPQLHSKAIAILLYALVSRVWVYAVLPASCYALCRVVPLDPWGSPVGAALTGELFYLALDIATAGFGGMLGDPFVLLSRAVTLAVGIVLANRAVKLALAANARVQAKADAVANARAAEYESFLKASEQVADRAEAMRPTGTGDAPPQETGSAEVEGPPPATANGEPPSE